MNKNSIKEDIKLLREMKNNCLNGFEYYTDPKAREKAEAIEHILSDYKRVLKENEILKKEKEQAWEEWNNLEQGSYETEQKLKQQIKESQKENEEWDRKFCNLQNLYFKLQDELESKRKEYQETYKDVREKLRELRKENEELKNGTRRNENELEVSIDGDWDALKKALDEAEKTNEYIIYDNEKWIKEKYCIPIQKVKDKIEELSKTKGDLATHIAVSERIRALQEILEESEE